MRDSDRYQFETNGYLTLEGALSKDQLVDLNQALDREFSDRRDTFYSRSDGTHQSVRLLEIEEVFDELIMHTATFDILKGLMNEDIAFSELSALIKEPGTDSHAPWHKDIGYDGIPLNQSLLLISCIYYLSDVPDNGACFSVVPGSHRFDRERPEVKNLEDMPGHTRLSAPAGTAIIFNANLWHAAMHERSGHERRTVHVYYCHPWMKPSGHTLFPQRFLDSADTPFLKKFYHENRGAAK